MGLARNEAMGSLHPMHALNQTFFLIKIASE